ncbi:MAG: 3-dehydroquinate synthase II [Thermoplasmata archaeon]|nr:3-dehydroquinate synthase II [Thermoplasmata archaeon]
MTDRDRIAVWLSGPERPVSRRLEERARQRGFLRFARRTDGAFLVGGIDGPLVPRPIGSAPELRRALRSPGPGEMVLLQWTSDRIIPLENAVASARGRIRIGVLVESPDGAPSALGALERGADLVIVPVPDEAALTRLEELLERHPVPPLDWRTAVVERIEPVGLGDRVIVDTTRLLRADDGMLVGSAAHFLFHVISETTGSSFSSPRPFRVNAGAPHSYVLMADGSTRYLAELSPGDRVLIARRHGPTGSARVGRLKIERRPMVLVGVRRGARHPTIFLQEAETVRLLGTRGTVPVTALTVGQRLQGVALPPGRHLGDVVDEGVEER